MKKPLFLIAMMVSLASFAQTSYTLSTYTASYAELTNATIMEEYDEDEDTWDDPYFTVPFGFEFDIAGETFSSTFQLSSGAFMAFGNILDPEDSLIHVFGFTDDIVDGDYIEGLPSSEISYTTVGTVGDRIAKIQYQNVAFYDEVEGPEPAAENRMNFQMWFYENGGILEIHYGTSNLPNPAIAFYGNPGPSMVLGINVGLDEDNLEYGAAIIGDPVNPTLVEFTTIPDEEFQTSLDGVPQADRVYRLAPSSPDGIFNAKAPEFSIYPTITQSNLWVKGETNAHANYRIMDITGKEVMSGQMQSQNAINVSSLNAGIYLFSIEGMSNAAKFIKQ